jgi:hypothetical protein
MIAQDIRHAVEHTVGRVAASRSEAVRARDNFCGPTYLLLASTTATRLELAQEQLIANSIVPVVVAQLERFLIVLYCAIELGPGFEFVTH